MNICLLLICLMFVLINTPYAEIKYVPRELSTIQSAINATNDGDTVLVSPGIYHENINYLGKKITVGSLFIFNNDTSYISRTIIDGSKIYSVVVFENQEDSCSALIGFTIQNGINNWNGAGIHCNNASPKLENLIISDNSAQYYGAGGGIGCLNHSHLIIRKVRVNKNIAYYGGGIYSGWMSNPKIENVRLSENSAIFFGGGAYFDCHSNPVISNSIIEMNTAINADGGGIFCHYHTDLKLANVIISKNKGCFGGGIFQVENCRLFLENVTISRNQANYGGGIFFYDSCEATIINSILWEDSPQEIYFSGGGEFNSLSISFSNLQGGTAGIITNQNAAINWLKGNITLSPVYCDTSLYLLSQESPCVDAGHPGGLYNDPENRRIPGRALWPACGALRNDLGAYGGPGSAGWNLKAQDTNDISYIAATNSRPVLKSNYPNPFNPTTTIYFELPKTTRVTLKIFNVLGQEVATLVSERLSAGSHSYEWSRSEGIASGMYVYRLEAENFVQCKKMLLVR